MLFTTDSFAELRPHVFHVTHASNVDRILSERNLQSTASLKARFEVGNDPNKPRRRAERLPDGVIIQNQSTLFAGNIQLAHGMTFGDFVVMLNSHVFFWPGSWGEHGHWITTCGRSYFKRYSSCDDGHCVLRMSTSEVFALNGAPKFCKYNSGAPRCNNGQKSPRGLSTFLEAESAPFRRGEVQEVVFQDRARLPKDIEVTTL